MQHPSSPGTRLLPCAGALAALFAFSALGCGDDPSPAAASINTPVTTTGGGTGGAPDGAVGTGVSGAIDSGSVSSAATNDAGVVVSTGGAAGTSGAGLDSPWCKAREVLARRCVVCHDGQGTAGTPLDIAFNDLGDLLADSKSTPGSKYYQRIGARIHDASKPMPPANDLAPADRALLDAWVMTGGAAGANPSCGTASTDAGVAASSDGGAVVVTADGGVYNEPWPADCEKHYKIQAHALNGGLSDPYMVPKGQEVHDNIIFDAPWGDEDVQSVAMRPITDNKRVLHHWILYAVNGGAFITGWAPGAENAAKLPDDVGMFVAKGKQSLRLNMHYYNREGSKDEPDQSGVEICTVSKAKFRKHTASVFSSFSSLGTGFVLAPANSTNYATTGNCPVTTTEPVTLLTASPHAHTLAVGMKFTAKVGGKDVLMHEGPFAFEEQRSYALSPPIVLNTGDTVTTTCIFTNPSNKDVTFGENTGNEMCFNFAVYYPMGALSCGFDLTGALDF
jgi:Copper type II ascorbate-dependent monooxygenase, C-terminal domain